MKRILKTLASLAAIISLMAALGGCVHKKDAEAGLRFWTPVEPEADSIVALLDARMANTRNVPSGQPVDTALTRRLAQIADSTGSGIIRARGLYFEGTLLSPGFHTKGDFMKIDSALALTDSAAYPYDAARYHASLTILYPRQIRPVIHLHCGDVFLAAGDSLRYARICNQLAFDMESNGDTINALKYYDLSIAIYNKMGLPSNAAGAVYNRLVYLDHSRPDLAAPIVDSLMHDSLTQANIASFPGLLTLAYKYDHNPAHLWRGYAVAHRPGMPGALLPLFESELATHYLRAGDRDSMELYRRLLASHLGQVRGVEYKVWPRCVTLYQAVGMADSAKIFQEKYAEWQRLRYAHISTNDMQHDLFRHELEQRAEAYEAKLAHQKAQRRAIIIAIAAILALAGAAAVWLSRRRRVARRQLDTVGRIRAMITSQSDWSDVERAFAEVDPEWTSRLKKRWPALTPGDVRMACLCYLNLDTKQIARILSIAPDSAKKNRQRLRAKLALTPDRHLRDILADL